MKKYLAILIVVLFSASLIAGGGFLSLIFYDHNTEVVEENEDYDEEIKTNATGYWNTSGNYATSFAGGSGTSSSPYLISNASQLARFAYLSNQGNNGTYNTYYYKLTADIDISAHYWIPIAVDDFYGFKGQFDGGGYIISGLTIDVTDSNKNYYLWNTQHYTMSFFSCIGENAIVKNFILRDISITCADLTVRTNYDNYLTCGVVGKTSYTSSAEISQVGTFGTIRNNMVPSSSSTSVELAGIGCQIGETRIEECFSYISLYTSSGLSASLDCCVGGIVSSATSGTIVDNCYFAGYISAYSDLAGGIAGSFSGDYISNCYSYYSGTWYGGYNRAGGIVGYLSSGTIYSCFADIYISMRSGGNGYKGGIVGYVNSSGKAYSSCYYSRMTAAYGYSSGTVSNCKSYSTRNYATSAANSSFFTSTSYLKAPGYGYNWDIYTPSSTYSSSYVWNKYVNASTYLNSGYPCLTWSFKQISASASPSSYGTASVGLSGTGAGSTTKASSRFAIKGMNLSFSCSATDANLYYFTSWSSGETSSSFTTFCSSSRSSYTAYFTTEGYWSSHYDSPISSGSGTSTSPYLISTARQLAGLAYYSNSSSYYSRVQSKYFKLTSDIDLSDYYWIPIGLKYYFSGNFDGDGHVISGLRMYYSSDNASYYYGVSAWGDGISYNMGLFGYVRGTIKSFVLKSPSLTTSSDTANASYSSYFSFVCAFAIYADISEIGIVGGTLRDNLTSVEKSRFLGGIVASMAYTDVSECFNNSSIYSSSALKTFPAQYSAGGIAGYVVYGCTIYDCFHNGHIDFYGPIAGGIAGSVNATSDNPTTIGNCYSYYSSTEWYGCRYGGGIAGTLDSYSYIRSCFADVAVRLNSNSNEDTTAYGAIVGSNSGYVYACCWYSTRCSSGYGSNSRTWSSCKSYTDQSLPLTYTSNSFYTSTSYLQASGYGRAWNITSPSFNSSYKWNKNIDSAIVNNGYPVLTWSVRKVSVSSDFSAGGSATVSLSGFNSDTTTGSSRYAVLGQTLSLSATSANSYYTFSGWSENSASKTYVSTNLSCSTEFCSTDVSEYVAVYSSSSTASTSIRTYFYNGLSSVASSTTVGSLSGSYYSSGHPADSSTSFSGSTSRSLSLYIGRTNTITASAKTGYKFKGWVRSTSSSVSTSDLSSFYRTSTSISITPTTTTSYYYTAVFEDISVTSYFCGNYVSTNNGSSYSSNNNSSIATSTVTYYTRTSSGTVANSINTTSGTFPSSFVVPYALLTQTTYKITINDSNYKFDGWYRYTSNNVSSATRVSTSTSYSPTASSTTYYYFAKISRKVTTINLQVMTSNDGGQTYVNSVEGGSPTISYYNSSSTLTTLGISTTGTKTISVQAGTTISVSTGLNSGYIFMGIKTGSSAPNYSTSSSIQTSVTCPTSTTSYYLFYNQASSNVLKYDSTEKYWYFEHGEYPQSYVGTSMNNTLNSVSPTKSGEIKYNDGTTNQKIEVYTYNSKKYARLQATSTQTLKMSDGTSYTFNKGTYYWFEVEPIRWRVSDYGVSSTSYPSGWSTYGTYKTNFTVVSDRILTIGSVTKKYPQTNNILSSITSDYSVTGNNLTIKYKASDKSFTLTNSSTSDPYATINHTVNLVQGMKYRVYMDVTNSSGVNASSRSIQMFYAIDGAYSEANSIKLGGDGQWKTFVAQKTGTYKIRIDNDTGGTAIIKNFQIQEADIAESWAFSSSDMYNNISGLNESASTTNFSANITNKQSSTNYTYYRFGDKQQQDKVISVSVNEDGVRVASIEEIDDYLSDYSAKASDMVCFLLGCGTDDKMNYWTRNLGTGLGNGQIVTKAGVTKSTWLDKVQGVRLSLTMGNGSRI